MDVRGLWEGERETKDAGDGGDGDLDLSVLVQGTTRS